MRELLAAGIGAVAAILFILLVFWTGVIVSPRERRFRANRRAYRNDHQMAHQTRKNGDRIGVDTVTDRSGIVHTRDEDGACIACGYHWSDSGNELFFHQTLGFTEA